MRTPEELRKMSELLHYEIWMFKLAGDELLSGRQPLGVIRNALIEAFGIHGRVLYDFLYIDRSKPEYEDAHAVEFVPSWPAIRTKLYLSEEVSDRLKKRVGIQIAHLGYKRTRITADEKPWNIPKINAEFLPIIARFLKEAPVGLLGPRCMGIREELSRLDSSATAPESIP